MSNSHRRLVDICVEALDTYDPQSRAVEDHINGFITNYSDGQDDDDETFIIEVFSGIVRYDQVISVVTNGFFVRDGKHILRSSENLYKVLCYLALFRLDELGMAHYRRFVRAQDTNKMYKFLKFFTDEKNLRTWIKDEWNKLYDASFVQRSLLSPILSHLPELKELVDQMKDKMDNKIQSKKISIKPTASVPRRRETKPFNITQPRPRSIPMPEPIPKLHKHRPTPKTTYKQPKEQQIMDEVRDLNRRKAEERLMEAAKLQFSCANPEKSEKTRRRLQEILDKEESKLEFDKHKSNPLPSSILKDNIPIRLNAAAILREGKLYQRRELEELKNLELLEAGARDPSDFIDWQNKMRKQDMDAELAEIGRRRLEGKLSHEEAILARQNLIVANKEKVAQMKEEAQQLMNEYLERRLQEEQEMRQLVETVMEGHENAKEAKKRLQEYKAKVVADVNEESRELMRVALEKAEEEMKAKMILIQEIRAMESKPVIRHKLVDLTTTGGYGLLSEMSIAELRERVAFLKIQEQEEEEEKRDNILASKQAKDQMLIDTLETIARHRRETSKAAVNKLETRKKTRTEKPAVEDEKLLELQRRLEEKRAERINAQQKSQLKPDKKSAQRLQQLSSAKKAGEHGRWEELEKSRERTAKLTSLGINSSKTASRLLTNNASAVAMY